MRRQLVMAFAAAALVVPSAAAFADHGESHGGGKGQECPEESKNPGGTPPNCGNQNPEEEPTEPETPPAEEPVETGTCAEGGLAGATVANQAAGTENEEGPVSSQIHANEGQAPAELQPVVHEVSCLVATVDNNLQ